MAKLRRTIVLFTLYTIQKSSYFCLSGEKQMTLALDDTSVSVKLFV